ncbi:MAG TPA: SIMPL domain-containing protein [Opitutaceae bacterium]|nr:SIMPL domain-containing protein [Opitutaceae bacterium]
MKIHALTSFCRSLNIRSIWLALVLSIVVPQAGCAAPHTVVRHGNSSAGALVEGISVTGTGKAFGQPNIARATVGVEVRAATADIAMRDVNAGVARVIAALKGVGIAESDLATQNLSLHLERQELPPPRPALEPPPATPPKGRPVTAPANDASLESKRSWVENYRAQNTLVVKIRNLDKAGAVLGAATAAGANLMFGLAFEIEEPRQLEEQAREKAMADARARAEGLARLAGVRLGPVVSIQESSGGVPTSAPVMMYKTQAADVPVERGELAVTIAVNAVYSIASK